MCLDCKGKHGNGTNTENRLDSDLGASQQTNQIKTIRVPIKEAISPVFMKDHSSSVSPRGNQLSGRTKTN